MTDDQAEFARITDALMGPYYRRCVEPCKTCGGGKTVVGVPKFCDTCNGTGLCWRKDQMGRELIAEAIEAVPRADAEEWFGYFQYRPSVRREAWESRDSKPYQAALESFVREYEAASPALDDERELKRLLWEADVEFSSGHNNTRGYHADVCWGDASKSVDHAIGPDSAALLAAVKAMIGESE